MRAIKRRDTEAELQLRRALHAMGHRFRVDFPLRVEGYERPIRPDVAFSRVRPTNHAGKAAATGRC
jgi:DNA mismatch endonuclease (patch repair protein)